MILQEREKERSFSFSQTDWASRMDGASLKAVTRIIMKIFLNILLIVFSIGFATIKESPARPSLAETLGKSATVTDFAYIDVHNHLSGGPARRTDYFGAARNALA
ncbi:MAG: hypothetical protein ABIH80_06390, partial [Methanobacteriota archaeon]